MSGAPVMRCVWCEHVCGVQPSGCHVEPRGGRAGGWGVHWWQSTVHRNHELDVKVCYMGYQRKSATSGAISRRPRVLLLVSATRHTTANSCQLPPVLTLTRGQAKW